MDAYGVARAAQRPGDRSVAPDAITGYGSEGDREASRAAGSDLPLVKPAPRELLIKELSAHAAA